MIKRNIVNIDQDKCIGCGLCINACHEGAIELVNGKAVLIDDEYCDGLGNCLPACPVGAIEITEREAVPFNKELVNKQKEEKKNKGAYQRNARAGGCPGNRSIKIERNNTQSQPSEEPVNETSNTDVRSELNQWPVQLNLINPNASYLDGADLLIAADCSAFAYGNFHKDFMSGKITVIGCPKLDDNNHYIEKLTHIIAHNDIKSITVVRMEVPCCGGIIHATKTAMLNAQKIVPYREVTISTDGRVISV